MLERSRHADPIAGHLHVLDHHHGIRASRYRSAGHDFDRFAGLHLSSERLARPDFADHAQFAWQIGGADRESIANRSRDRRIIAIGRYVLGQHTAGGFEKRDFLCRGRWA